MLTGLSIRDVVVIEHLSLTFGMGLCALTGETGAGKSILIDSLALALGRRADPRLIRPGADKASVAASFDVAPDHPARATLAGRALPNDDEIVLRRVLNTDGRSRAFVNDEPVSVGFLSLLGAQLVEIYGQNDRLGLLDRETHRAALDRFGGLGATADRTRDTYQGWQAEAERLQNMTARAADADKRLADLKYAIEELEALAPEPDEERTLAARRSLLMASEKIAEALGDSMTKMIGDRSIDDQLQAVRRAVAGLAEIAPERVMPLAAALDRAAAEIDDAIHQMQSLAGDLDVEEGALDQVERRLFALRDIARKHAVEVEQLPELAASISAELSELDEGEQALDRQRAVVAAARDRYEAAAAKLTDGRTKAGRRLDKRIAGEMSALGLGGARFRTQLHSVDAEKRGPNGAERIEFEVATVTGAAFGPIQRVASGGELSRFMLALRVAMAEKGDAETLIFDEIDAGIGGAVADAVGQRLALLGQQNQIMAVTHQPQIAARATRHYRVSKQSKARKTKTDVEHLSTEARIEEIARMVAGAQVTAEARAAARKLIDGAREAALAT